MTADKVEGTIVFDGLLQGRVPDEAVGAQLNEWAAFVAKLGPRFSLELRGGAFSLLPEPQPVSVAGLGDNPAETVRQALEQLAHLFTGPERMQLFSTLRSSEFRPQREVQSVYAITGGQVGVQSRTVEAQTTPPPVPVSTKERLKVAGVGLLMACVLLGIALLFPGVRAMFRQVVETVKPFDVKEVTVDAGPYAPWVKWELDEKRSNRATLAVVLTRTAAYPLDEATFAAAETAAGADFKRRFALENLARGHVRIDFYDDTGKYLQTGELRVAELATKESVAVMIGLPERIKIGKLVFVP